MTIPALDLNSEHHKPSVASRRLGLRAYILAAEELLAREGYRYSVETDLGQWSQLIGSARRTDGRNRAFTPGESTPPDDAFWIKVSDQSGSVAAVAAARYIDTDLGFYDYVRTGRMWRTGGNSLHLLVADAGPKGRLCHTGGIWVCPDHSGKGLSWLISRLNHAIAVTRWDLDYVFGMCFEKLINIGVDRNYGAQRTRLLLTAPFGEGGSQTKVFALENPRNYIEDRSTRDFVSIWDEPGKKMRDLAPYAKRNDQPAKASR